MNGLQSGTSASSLSPQAFKNSSQSGTLQGSQSVSGVQQQAGTTSLTATSASYTLQVVDNGQSSFVLGVAKASQSTTNDQPTTAETQTTNIFPALLILVGSLALAIFFYKKYVFYSRKENDEPKK